jgi:Protein kinase domain/Galactose oxidase, central domain
MSEAGGAQGGQSSRQPIPGYVLTKKLGEGGMAATYLARQTSMDRLVAIKIMRRNLARDASFISRFEREAKLAGSLNHVNIVGVHEVGEGGGFHYLAMEYVKGKSAYEMMPDTGGMDEELALHIAMQVARGLDYAHQHGIIHRDIKPDNILVTEDRIAKVCDFGLARHTAEETRMTQTGIMLGTPHYVSPEQARGDKDVDIRSDIYSLGATLYQFATGETPFQGSSAAVVMTKHLTEELPWPADVNPMVSENVCRLIARMMAKDREDRYQTPAELLTDLELVIDGKAPQSEMLAAGRSSVGQRGASELKRALRQKRRQRLAENAGTAGQLLEPVEGPRSLPLGVLAGIGAAAVLLLGVVGWMLLRSSGNGSDAARVSEAAASQAWAEKIIPLEKLESKDQAIELLANLGAFKGAHGDTDFAKGKLENMVRLKLNAEQLLAGGGTPPPAGDEKLKEMYEYAESLWKKNQDDHKAAIARFEKVRSAGKDTKWELMAEEAVANVKKARLKALEATYKDLRERAEKLIKAGDYDGAMGVFDQPAEKFGDALKPRCATERAKLKHDAEARFKAAISAAEQCSKDGVPEKGLAELAKVKSLRYAAYAPKLGELSARLEKEKLDVAANFQKQKLARARKAFESIMTGYDELMLAGKWRRAGEFVAGKKQNLDAQVRKDLPPGLDEARKIAKLLADWQAGRKDALKDLVGKQIELKKRTGDTVKGELVKVLGNTLFVKVTFRIGGTVGSSRRDVRFSELAPGELEKLLPAFKAKGTGGHLAAMHLAMSRKDFPTARRELASAGKHHLTRHYATRIEIAEKGAVEFNAEKVWLADVAPLLKKEYAPKEAKAVLAALDGYRAAHGSTKFAATRKSEVANARALAQDATDKSPDGMLAKVQKLFHGKVVKFDPKTLMVELLYDFSDEGQLEDWCLSDQSAWKIAAGRLQATKTPSVSTMLSKASFAGFVRVIRHVMPSDGQMPSVLFVKENKGAQSRFTGLYWELQNTPTYVLNRLHAANKKILWSGKYPKLRLPVTVSATYDGGTFAGVLAGKQVMAIEHRLSSPIHCGFVTDNRDETVTDNLRITGKLDRAWLEGELKRLAAREAPASAFRAQWRQLALRGERPVKRNGITNAMTYDRKRKCSVLFGGNWTKMNDLWTLDLGAMRWTCLQKNLPKGREVGTSRPAGGTAPRLTCDEAGDAYWLHCSWAFSPTSRRWRKRGGKFEGQHGWVPPAQGRCGWSYDPHGRRFLGGKPQAGGYWFGFFDTATNRAGKIFKSPAPNRTYLDGGLAYDRRNKVFVIFGGGQVGGKPSLGDTWTFNPQRNEWRQVRPRVSPPARTWHKLVWHDKLGALVMVGGSFGWDAKTKRPAFSYDLWVYETAADRWTEIKTPLASPAAGGATTYDAAHDRLVLFNDNGQTWTCKIELDPSSSQHGK